MSEGCNHLDVVDVARELHRIANGTGEMLDTVGTGFDNLVGLLQEDAPLGAVLWSIAYEMKRLNDNLEAGTLNIRTHHPLCVTPRQGDYTVQQLDVMSKFLNTAIDEGRLALPQREATS